MISVEFSCLGTCDHLSTFVNCWISDILFPMNVFKWIGCSDNQDNTIIVLWINRDNRRAAIKLQSRNGQSCNYTSSSTYACCKMYRQVLIYPEQLCLQRILWRDEPAYNISIYGLNTVTSGRVSAAFLAICGLYEMTNKINELSLNKVYYTEGVLCGWSPNSCGDISYIKTNITDIPNSLGLSLRKFISNCSKVVSL